MNKSNNNKQQKIKKKEGRSNPIETMVSVTVIIFPDGGTHFFENKPVFKNKPNENIEYIQKCMRIWKKDNEQRYTNNPGIMGAVAHIEMLESDYYAMPATSEFTE